MGKRKTRVEFIKECNEKHDNFYDYSILEYSDIHNEIKIICPKHGEFTQAPEKYING